MTQQSSRSSDLPYFLPMAIFLAFTQIGVWYPNLYALVYTTKTIIVAITLIYFWKRYTPIRQSHLWLGVLIGIIGIFQWVGMEKLLLLHGPTWTHMSGEPIDPFKLMQNRSLAWSFISFRWMAAFLLVPIMEELFWRDWLWRTIIAPNDFKLAYVGEWDPKAFFVIPAIFAAVHVQWLTAVAWALMIGLLLLKTKSLGACIAAHAVTNFLLGAYVLAAYVYPQVFPHWMHVTHVSEWYFW